MILASVFLPCEVFYTRTCRFGRRLLLRLSPLLCRLEFIFAATELWSVPHRFTSLGGQWALWQCSCGMKRFPIYCFLTAEPQVSFRNYFGTSIYCLWDVCVKSGFGLLFYLCTGICLFLNVKRFKLHKAWKVLFI